jgi:hypothetical protein
MLNPNSELDKKEKAIDERKADEEQVVAAPIRA